MVGNYSLIIKTPYIILYKESYCFWLWIWLGAWFIYILLSLFSMAQLNNTWISLSYEWPLPSNLGHSPYLTLVSVTWAVPNRYLALISWKIWLPRTLNGKQHVTPILLKVILYYLIWVLGSNTFNLIYRKLPHSILVFPPPSYLYQRKALSNNKIQQV